MQIKIKKLSSEAVIPKYSKQGDCGLDLTATSIESNNMYTEYGTSLAIEIPEGFVGLIFPRSSISNYHQTLSNSVGVIDSNYRGEIKFRFKNASSYPYSKPSEYKVGERVGQLIIMPYPQVELVEAEELSDTNRGTGGFGSSGV